MKYLIALLFLVFLNSCKKETVKSVTIKADVTFLSDDALEGRQTGTKGEKAAAEYIAKRLENLGLEGKGTNEYFQVFSFKPKT